MQQATLTTLATFDFSSDFTLGQLSDLVDQLFEVRDTIWTFEDGKEGTYILANATKDEILNDLIIAHDFGADIVEFKIIDRTQPQPIVTKTTRTVSALPLVPGLTAGSINTL